MKHEELDVVTGAFGFTGKYITVRLLERGVAVRTITGHPNRPSPFGTKVEARAFDFDRPERLVESLRGVDTLFNTYWIRFEYGKATFQQAVTNSRTLIAAAKEAQVRKIVHISISNPSLETRLPYFRGKALVEEAVKASGLSYAIIRPTVMYGPEGILINNIAWLLRRLPVFAVAGDGKYRLQPVFVADVAEMAVRAGQEAGNLITDAVGPEVYTFNGLVGQIRAAVRSKAIIVHVEPRKLLLIAGLLGRLVNDIVLTRDEILGLTANLLVSRGEPSCPTRFTDWLGEYRGSVGTRYASELAKHWR